MSFYTSLTGLNSASAQLGVTSNNIANVNVPGYSRQKVVLTTVPGQYASNGYVGQGVTVQMQRSAVVQVLPKGSIK